MGFDSRFTKDNKPHASCKALKLGLHRPLCNLGNPPPNQSVTVLPGQFSPDTAFYSVSNPVLVVDRVAGLGMTGLTGTVYRLEKKSALTAGAWLPGSTNTIVSNGFNLVLPNPATTPPPASTACNGCRESFHSWNTASHGAPNSDSACWEFRRAARNVPNRSSALQC